MKRLFSTLLGILILTLTRAQVLPTPTDQGKNDNSDLTTGMKFIPRQKSIVAGLMYYRGSNFTGSTVGHLWDATGKLLAQGTFPGGNGWQTLTFNSPILVDSAKEYTASFSNDGGYYCFTENFFPKTYPLYIAKTSNFSWYRNTYPTLTYNETNYFIEPVIFKYAPSQPQPDPVIIRDTIRILVDTCSIDYAQINNMGFNLVLCLPEASGGTVRLPDSTTVYQAIYGAMPPHLANKDNISLIMYRFQRPYVINGVSKSVRFTMYKTGAWIRELKNAAGTWEIFNYAPY